MEINWNNCSLQPWICYRCYGYFQQNHFTGNTITSLNQLLHFRLLQVRRSGEIRRLPAQIWRPGKRWRSRLVNVINYLPHKIFLLTPSLEGWPTKANKAPSPREVRLTLPDIIPVFLCFRDKLVIVFYPNKINVPSRITPLWRQCFLFFHCLPVCKSITK